ncbi:MAG TPA: undecaprenyldiphospho-muramoylpentapeptide beta-N-acetylglucosaminyltransferase [Paenibacillus sp.]|jgi:UDP-N-acetylglucosamine--N-acetylmuramyl-(pentapeptide) pyrophosphoryl-undecaprenol N-acetylglucosamine transferase
MKRKIVFTGGGSAGHVAANLVLMSRLLQEEWEIHYIGSKHGIERQLVSDLESVQYHAVATGKLRRYWAWANVTDVFKIMLGVLQAYRLIFQIKPRIVFSLGGFVAVPVVIGARWNGDPVLILEPDLHPGLANRLSRKFARTMCTTFVETTANDRHNDGKMVHVGPIVREELKLGSRARGIRLCEFIDYKPILLIMGGSQGAERINRMVRAVLPELLKSYQVIHICGTGKMDLSIQQYKGYKQFEYVREDLPDLMAMADLVVSRAGSNAIHEWLLLRKPMLLIPHANGGSRIGQTLNAKYFLNAGYAELLHEEDMTNQAFLKAIENVYQNRESYVDKMKSSETGDAINKVLALISKTERTRKERAGI